MPPCGKNENNYKERQRNQIETIYAVYGEIKMKKRFFLMTVCICLTVSLLAGFTAVASADYSVGVTDNVPVWAAAHTDNIRTEFQNAATGLGNAKGEMTAIIDNNSRVLLLQEFENGAVYMNEADGKAYSITDTALYEYWYNEGSPKGVILGNVISKDGTNYLLTDTTLITNVGGTIREEDVGVGTLPGDYSDRVPAARLTDRFTDAYRLAANFVTGYELGLPVSAVTSKMYVTKDLQANGKYVDPLTTGDKTYYMQSFEGGYIIQARLTRSPHYAAAPISTAMYNYAIGLTGNSTLDLTGAPVSREYTVNGVTMQNFEYGYVKVEGGVASFVEDKVVAPNGTEMYRKVGSFEDNWDKAWNIANTYIEYNQVRKSEQIRTAIGALIDSGKIEGFNADASTVGHPCHEYFGRGAMQKFTVKGAGANVGGANLFAIVGYWYDDVYVVCNGDFTSVGGAYFAEGENKLDVGLGFPVSNVKRYKSITYQLFTWGIIYREDGMDSYTCYKQAAYTEWLGDHKSVEEVFDENNDDELDSVYKNKFSYASSNNGYTITYAEDKSFHINKALSDIWMDGLSSFASACAQNGEPVYATDDYLVTTKNYYEIRNDSAEKLSGLGALDVEADTPIFGGSVTYDANAKFIITDAFADAYLFAWLYDGFVLGKVSSDAQDTTFVDFESQEPVSYMVQEFQNGKIYMSTYEDAAVAVYGNILAAIDTLGGLPMTGVPTARQYTLEGITYINTSFGYIKAYEEIEGADAPQIVYDKAVGLSGKEIDKNIGRFESRKNIAKGGADFEHEVLRIYESYVRAYEQAVSEGYRMYTGSVKKGHEWNGNGLSQSFVAGSSTSSAWGQQKLTVMTMASPYSDAVIVRNAILDLYARLGGNNLAGNYGMALENDFSVEKTLLNTDGEEMQITLTFQNFERGVIVSYIAYEEVFAKNYSGAYADENGTLTDASGAEIDLGITVQVPDLTPPVIEEPEKPQDSEPKKGCNSNAASLFGLIAIIGTTFVFGKRR